MRIIARSKIVEYYTLRPDSRIALEDWFHKVRNAEWNCFTDIRQTFRSADSIGNQRFVFNIKGNHHRSKIHDKNCFHPVHRHTR